MSKFSKVLALPSTSFPEPWARWLEAKGNRLPENLSDLHYKPVENYPKELYNLADDSAFAGSMFEYARKMLSWRMANDERTLTAMNVGPEGLVESNR